MGCTRTKYNMLCEGTAGSLLENVAAFPSTSHLASFLGSLLPQQCSFLTARDGTPNSYRIDPELDKEIKRITVNLVLWFTVVRPLAVANCSSYRIGSSSVERRSNEAASTSSGRLHRTLVVDNDCPLIIICCLTIDPSCSSRYHICQHKPLSLKWLLSARVKNDC
uniref:Uncharacterized protein n=1 Tax=Angiostrongylus cantonensis TaxID=6313 RepID=A0A0K0CXE0_ANGCA